MFQRDIALTCTTSKKGVMMRQHPYRPLVLWCGFLVMISLGGASQAPLVAQADELLVCRGVDGVLRNPEMGQDCVVGETAYLIQAVLRDPPPVADSEPPGFEGTVAAHNAWRQAVGVPDLAWSNEVATTAQEWADLLASPEGGCRLEHRPNAGENARPFGENLYQAFAFPDPPQVTPQDVVDAWGNESQDYDAATHTCAPGAVCGHYTQVVWRETQVVGCGMATCMSDGFQSIIWVCNYDPPGNIIGQTPF